MSDYIRFDGNDDRGSKHNQSIVAGNYLNFVHLYLQYYSVIRLWLLMILISFSLSVNNETGNYWREIELPGGREQGDGDLGSGADRGGRGRRADRSEQQQVPAIFSDHARLGDYHR